MNASALISRYGKTVSLVTQATGTVGADYTFTTTENAPVDITMFIEPVSGRDLLLLPQGERAKKVMRGYTATEIKVTSYDNQLLSDKIVDGSTTYEVHNVEYWEANNFNLQPYYVCLLVEMNPTDGVLP